MDDVMRRDSNRLEVPHPLYSGPPAFRIPREQTIARISGFRRPDQPTSASPSSGSDHHPGS